MERWNFDLDRIRKNWERSSEKADAGATTPAASNCPACGAPSALAPATGGTAEKGAPAGARAALLDAPDLPRGAVPARFARLEAPRDPYPDAEAMVARIRSLIRGQLSAQESIISPFVDDVEQLIQRLAAKPAEGEPPVDKKKLRADLDKALGDLEDMVAVWSGIGR